MTIADCLPILLLHPGKQHSPQTALALQQLGRLKSYATSIFYDPNRFPYFLERIPGTIGKRLHFEFSRFAHPQIDPALVRTWGAFEWLERLALRAGAVRLSYQLDNIGNKRFARGLTRDICSASPFAIWGYNGSALEAFRLAKRQGRYCILDRTIGDFRYFNEVMAEQQALYPQFFSAEERRMDARRIELDDEEYELADKVLVGSDFCRKTLVNFSPVSGLEAKTEVIPYCPNNHDFPVETASGPDTSPGPLRFLFAGRIVPRKGIHLLLEAMSRFSPNEATLTIVGKMLIPEAAYAPYADRVHHIPSVAPSEVSRVMRAHHVLVLPSFFEGSAITLLEALSSGMGIIQSYQAGNGASERTGIVLDDNATEQLFAAMQIAVQNRELVEYWRNNAVGDAVRFSADAYRDHIAEMLSGI